MNADDVMNGEMYCRALLMIEAERKELFKWRRLALYFVFLAVAFVGVSIYQNYVVMKQRAEIRLLWSFWSQAYADKCQ